MKRKPKKRAGSTRLPRVQITCELGFEDEYALTHTEAKNIEQVLRAAITEALPHVVQGCWIHRAPKYLGKKRLPWRARRS